MIFGGSPPSTPKTLKILLIANIAVFVVDVLTKGAFFTRHFSLNIGATLYEFELWRVASYMFLHNINGVFHIFFNMLMLWIFGMTIISELGEKRFLSFYLLAGLFAGICTVAYSFAISKNLIVTGASGAILALMILFALYYPNREIYIWGLFPVKAKWLVLILVGVDLLFLGSNDGFAHSTHLGGALFGFLYFKFSGKVLNAGSWIQNKKMDWKETKFSRAAEDSEEMMEKIDSILKKISEVGMEGLTKEEKKTLDKASELKKKQQEKLINLEEYRRSRR